MKTGTGHSNGTSWNVSASVMDSIDSYSLVWKAVILVSFLKFDFFFVSYVHSSSWILYVHLTVVHKSSNFMAATPELKHIVVGIPIFQAVIEVCHSLIPILIFNCISPRRRNEHPSLPSPLTSDDADVGSFFCFKYLQLFISPNSCSQILTAQHSHCNIVFGRGWHDHCLWEAVDNYAMKTGKKDDRLYLTSQFSTCDSSTMSVNS